MERLTVKINGTYEIKGIEDIPCGDVCERNHGCETCKIHKAVEKLAEYENAEEQGLLLRLLCNINDTVFTISKINLSIELLYVENICLEKYENNIHIRYTLRTLDKNGYEYKYNSDFGKTVFLAAEEAEQALAKMK